MSEVNCIDGKHIICLYSAEKYCVFDCRFSSRIDSPLDQVNSNALSAHLEIWGFGYWVLVCRSLSFCRVFDLIRLSINFQCAISSKGLWRQIVFTDRVTLIEIGTEISRFIWDRILDFDYKVDEVKAMIISLHLLSKLP